MPPPGTVPPGPPVDLNAADWLAAQDRRVGTTPRDGPSGPVDLTPSSPLADEPTLARARSRNRGRTYFTRAWAAVKISVLFASTWWTMESLRFKLGETICGYGAVLLFSAFQASTWRKRYFGPGQQLEPELYEVVVQWFYGAGIVLVLLGGAVFAAQAV